MRSELLPAVVLPQADQPVRRSDGLAEEVLPQAQLLPLVLRADLRLRTVLRLRLLSLLLCLRANGKRT